MSTRSLLYRAFGLGTIEPMSSEFEGGRVCFHVRTPLERLCCAHCHSAEVIRRGTYERQLRLVPIGSKPCVAVVSVQRLECRVCGRLAREHLAFAVPRRSYTRQFARYVLELSRFGTIRDVARHLKVSWDLVREIQHEDMQKEVAKIDLAALRRLAIDELAIGKGHRYVTVVMDLDSGQVVHVGDGKGAEAVDGFFARLKQRTVPIEAVAMDMSGAYQLVVRRHLPEAAIVFDHFHVVKLMNEALSTLRRQVQNDADALAKKTLKGTRWLLLKNPENLDADKDEPARLEAALALNRPLALGYYLKEDLRQLWEQPDAATAESLLDDWIGRARATGLQVLKTMATTLDRHRQGILAYYTHRLSTGPLEGFNNKAQTMKRQAYGYRNLPFYKLKLMTLHRKRYALVG